MTTPTSGLRELPRVNALTQVVCLLAGMGLVVNLFLLGSQPYAVGLVPHPWDKVAHFVVYSAITALLWFGTAARWPFAVFVLVIALGIVDELNQASLPGRVADGADLLIDFIAGGTISALLYIYVHPRIATGDSAEP